MNSYSFQPPDVGEDDAERDAAVAAHWEKQLTDAYASGRKDEREDCMRLLNWSYRKLSPYSFSTLDDALMLDEIKLMQEGAA